MAALQSLHEIVISKRSRNTPLVALEPIMLRFVELCVNLRKGKTAKEGLHQYKNISQNTSVATIEVSGLQDLFLLINYSFEINYITNVDNTVLNKYKSFSSIFSLP